MIHVMVANNMVKKAGRLYTTEAGDARMAATWLNAAVRTAAGKRILALRDDLAALLRLLEPGRALYLQRAGLPSLNARLERYLFSPALMFDPQTDQFQTSTLPRNNSGPKAMLGDIEVCESTVAAALVRLAAQRRLEMLHLCDSCGAAWHVAARSIDRFCSTRCRDAWHARSPEGVQRRREIQRRYRQNVNLMHTKQDAARKGRS